jgi:hypothetical protein
MAACAARLPLHLLTAWRHIPCQASANSRNYGHTPNTQLPECLLLITCGHATCRTCLLRCPAAAVHRMRSTEHHSTLYALLKTLNNSSHTATTQPPVASCLLPAAMPPAAPPWLPAALPCCG